MSEKKQTKNTKGSKTKRKNQQNDKKLEQLRTELENEKNKKLQLMADFENYKKRIEKERATFAAMANLALIQEILEVSDDIDLALSDADLNLERAKESLNNAKSKLSESVKLAGVEKIEIKKGDVFNKDIMEAISVVPDPNFKNKVIAVISSAYKYKDREGVIRPAKVIVGK